MPNQSTPQVAETDLVQAFQDVLKGEKTATAMESQLAIIERKIDDLLASVDPPNELVPNLPEEGLRNERDDASSENKRLEKGKASENKTGEGSK